MSAYSTQHFSFRADDEVQIELRAHPDLPHLMLTISMDEKRASFTLAAPNTKAREIIRRIAALFEGPEIPAGETRRETSP